MKFLWIPSLNKDIGKVNIDNAQELVAPSRWRAQNYGTDSLPSRPTGVLQRTQDSNNSSTMMGEKMLRPSVKAPGWVCEVTSAAVSRGFPSQRLRGIECIRLRATIEAGQHALLG